MPSLALSSLQYSFVLSLIKVSTDFLHIAYVINQCSNANRLLQQPIERIQSKFHHYLYYSSLPLLAMCGNYTYEKGLYYDNNSKTIRSHVVLGRMPAEY